MDREGTGSGDPGLAKEACLSVLGVLLFLW
jgi:hypothetical protein